MTVEARLRLYRQRQTCRALTNAWVALATAGGRLDPEQFRLAARYALDGLAIGEALAQAAVTDPEADQAAAQQLEVQRRQILSGPSTLTYPEGWREQMDGRRRAFEDE